ncbi:MAG: hypothetical protein ACK4TR_17260 [Phenylobacterium sp.]|uniref:hypothetical protein n=1 Tax=Phenylobacterium sp. TaxID=1871053 RepID=UPI00391945E5
MTAETPDPDPRPTVRALLADPTVRRPLKVVLRRWVERDPVDAAQDAELLALALERLADERCAAAFVLRSAWPADPGGFDDRRHL